MLFQKQILTLLAIGLSCSAGAETRKWTLQQCLDYAQENNIQLKQKAVATKSSREEVLLSKGQLLPSVSFSTSQNMNYRPNSAQTTTLEGGTMAVSNNAVSYNGSYGINARWTVWDGGKNRLGIKQSQLSERQSEYEEKELANSIQEQITQLYVQILYETEAVKVCEELLKASNMQVERGKVMLEVGSIAKVDLVQLEAQAAQDELSLVTAQSQLENFKLQLRQMLEIHDNNDFEVATIEIPDDKVMELIPSSETVYSKALAVRPEIQRQKLNIENSKLSLQSARTGYVPSISMNGGIGSSNSSGQHISFGSQLKTNLSYSLGASISVPIFDNHSTRTNIRKAKYAQETAQLQLQDAEKQLYSTIENCYLDATTNQKKFIYAKKNAENMLKSYELVSEQFSLGLKNIVELTTGKNNLMQAEQQLLETKFTTLYNIALLRFYQGERIAL